MKALVRWATGKRLTNRLPKLRLTTKINLVGAFTASDGYRYRTEPKIPEIRYRYAIPKYGISVFVECPRTAYIQQHLRPESEPQRNTTHDLTGILVFVRRAYSMFCFVVFSNIICFEDMYYGITGWYAAAINSTKGRLV